MYHVSMRLSANDAAKPSMHASMCVISSMSRTLPQLGGALRRGES